MERELDEYAQAVAAPLVEALREARGVMDDIASTSHVECLSRATWRSGRATSAR